MPELKPLVGKHAYSYRDSQARLNIWDGSVRSGKTVASLLRWLDYVRNGPRGNLALIGKTERTIKRNVIDPLVDMVGPARCRAVQGSGELWLLGRRIYLAGANDERSELKIRGLTLAGAYGDEITTWPQSFFTTLLARMSVTGAQFFGTTNPDSPLHWLMVDYLQREDELGPEHLRRFRFGIDDNPYLDPSYVSMIKAEYRGLWYRRFIAGDWCVAEGAVYDMLDLAVHTVKELPPLVRHWVGIDYGTSNPTVYVMLSLGADGRLYIHHEYRWDPKITGRQKTDAELSKDYLRWAEARLKENKVGPERVWYDPSAASFGLQLYRDDVKRLAPADNTVLEGIRNVSSLIGAGVLLFHEPTTSEGLREMVSLAWDPKAQEKGDDKPIKALDHFPDATRYVVRGAWNHCRRILVEWQRKQRMEGAKAT